MYMFCQPCRNNVAKLAVSVSSSRVVLREFAPRPDHIKDLHKNGTNCLPQAAWRAGISVGVWLCSLSDCVKGRVVCGTVWCDTYYKNLLGLIDAKRHSNGLMNETQTQKSIYLDFIHYNSLYTEVIDSPGDLYYDHIVRYRKDHIFGNKILIRTYIACMNLT